MTAEANQTRVLGQVRTPKYFFLQACEPQWAGTLADTDRDRRPRGAVATGEAEGQDTGCSSWRRQLQVWARAPSDELGNSRLPQGAALSMSWTLASEGLMMGCPGRPSGALCLSFLSGERSCTAQPLKIGQFRSLAVTHWLNDVK